MGSFFVFAYACTMPSLTVDGAALSVWAVLISVWSSVPKSSAPFGTQSFKQRFAGQTNGQATADSIQKVKQRGGLERIKK